MTKPKAKTAQEYLNEIKFHLDHKLDAIFLEVKAIEPRKELNYVDSQVIATMRNRLQKLEEIDKVTKSDLSTNRGSIINLESVTRIQTAKIQELEKFARMTFWQRIGWIIFGVAGGR